MTWKSPSVLFRVCCTSCLGLAAVTSETATATEPTPLPALNLLDAELDLQPQVTVASRVMPDVQPEVASVEQRLESAAVSLDVPTIERQSGTPAVVVPTKVISNSETQPDNQIAPGVATSEVLELNRQSASLTAVVREDDAYAKVAGRDDDLVNQPLAPISLQAKDLLPIDSTAQAIQSLNEASLALPTATNGTTQTPSALSRSLTRSTIAQSEIAQSGIDAQNKGQLPTPASLPTTAPEPLLQPELSPTPPGAKTGSPGAKVAPKIQVNQIQVNGSTVLSDQTIAQIVQPSQGKQLGFTELQQVADRLTQEYLKAGYLTSRAIIKEQTVKNGVLTIDILEGELAQVDVIGLQRLSETYIRQRIQRGIQKPLNQPNLEDQLRLLKLDPLLSNVEASLRQGEQPGQSILTVRVAEAPAIFGVVGFDNDSVPSVGSERIGGTIGYGNLTGAGDRLYASYYRSLTGGANLWDFSYQRPLNPMQGTLQLRVAPSRYRITNGDFADLGISGGSNFYDVGIRQPLVRSPRQEFALSLGFAHRNGETLISDVLVDESATSVLRFGQDWLKRDTRGFWTANSQFNFGTDWLGATRNQIPDGQFFNWTGELSRTQFFNANNALRVRANWQLTPDALLPSQQFIIGGRQSLRGFRQNFRSGDNGIGVSLEHQVTLKRNVAGVSMVQFVPFFDMGWVWNARSNPAPLPQQRFLAGLGMGLRWQPTEKLDLQLDYALPLVRPVDRGSNLQDAAVYFNLKYRF